MKPIKPGFTQASARGFLPLLEAGRRLGGLSAAEVCELVTNRQLAGVLVDGSLRIPADAVAAFIAHHGPRLVWSRKFKSARRRSKSTLRRNGASTP